MVKDGGKDEVEVRNECGDAERDKNNVIEGTQTQDAPSLPCYIQSRLSWTTNDQRQQGPLLVLQSQHSWAYMK